MFVKHQITVTCKEIGQIRRDLTAVSRIETKTQSGQHGIVVLCYLDKKGEAVLIVTLLGTIEPLMMT